MLLKGIFKVSMPTILFSSKKGRKGKERKQRKTNNGNEVSNGDENYN